LRSPNTPRSIARGRKPGNRYESARRIGFDELDIEISCQVSAVPKRAETQHPQAFQAGRSLKLTHTNPRRPEILFRNFGDRKAVARYAGLTGTPDESGSKRREKGLSRCGNGRVRNILIRLSWRLLKFQPASGLVLWFKNRTANVQRSRKPMIVAFARKLIIALERNVNTSLVSEGFHLRSAA
jgi:transposase